MFPNAKPAVDAVDAVGRLGGFPAFLFSHPVVAGFVALIMLPAFAGMSGGKGAIV